MLKFDPIIKSDYGSLDPKVNLLPDFFSGFEPDRRKEIVTEEAKFYHKITAPYSVDNLIEKNYTKFRSFDGMEVSVKVYRPKNCSKILPVMVFIHGGGFITCSIETHDFVPSYIAANANIEVINVEYRLAPEYKFPTGLEDCYEALRWITQNADKLRVNAQKISVGGDSSGGNFAASLCLMAKNRGDIKIDRQVLIYAVLDLTNEVDKQAAKVYGPVGGAEGEPAEEPGYIRAYLSNNDNRKNPYISPIFANEFSLLPKALFIQAECDSLCDDGLIYAKMLQDAGVSVDVKIYKGMPHAFILRTYNETFSALDKVCKFLKN